MGQRIEIGEWQSREVHEHDAFLLAAATGAREMRDGEIPTSRTDCEGEEGERDVDGAEVTDRPRPDGNGMRDRRANKCRETDAIKYTRSVDGEWGTDSRYSTHQMHSPRAIVVVGIHGDETSHVLRPVWLRIV